MERFRRSDIVEVGRIHSGTSAAFIGFNTKTQQKGIYKINGCILDVKNEDIREKLASEILHTLNIPCANIDLIYDDELKQCACFSNYILTDSEELITPNTYGISSTSTNLIQSYFEKYMKAVNKITTDQQTLYDCNKNLANYIYLCCILDCYDIKADNLPLKHNIENNSYSPAAWFDFGTAFTNEKRSLDFNVPTENILEYLFKNHYEDIQDTVHNLHQTLTPDKLKSLCYSKYVIDSIDEQTIKDIYSGITFRIKQSKQFQMQLAPQKKSFVTFVNNLKDKIQNLFKKNVNSLPFPNNNYIERNDISLTLHNLIIHDPSVDISANTTQITSK